MGISQSVIDLGGGIASGATIGVTLPLDPAFVGSPHEKAVSDHGADHVHTTQPATLPHGVDVQSGLALEQPSL